MVVSSSYCRLRRELDCSRLASEVPQRLRVVVRLLVEDLKQMLAGAAAEVEQVERR